ncbi:MAG: UDP-N-acetylmuramate dehydrogenase [Ruminococcaceae bacterium]|nr:UDP-N-acetylmuramate dehydrogenase [Oscillospiraceae bacterium]
MTALCDFLKLNEIEYFKDEPMSRHTSFRIGGPADYFILPDSKEKLAGIIEFCKNENISFTVIGKGSNLLVSDKGIEGAVLCTSNLNSIILKDNNRIVAEAGVSLASLCSFAKENGLTGLEFAYGIPGSVGGAMVMNAGAYSGEMKDVAVKTTVLDNKGNMLDIVGKDMRLSYRNSIFKAQNLTVLSSEFLLKPDKKEEICARMDDFLSRRKSKQPLEYPSAGSVFKRPEGYFAGALIEENNLKGVSVGGAQVSEKHAGFIINKNAATCSDVKTLIVKIQDKILKNNGVKLETELIFKGRE